MSSDVILVADSSADPSPAQVAAAKAAGYRAWLGYRASSANENLLHPWPASAFVVVKAGGLLAGAFYSGLDDPGWAKADAASLGIPGFLDCESGIRGDGTWTDPWLAASGFGLYGGETVQAAHLTHGHRAYIFAAYPGVDETASWPSGVAAPPQPKGWQWADPAVKPVSWASIDTSNYEQAVLAAPQEGEMLLIFVAKVVAGPAAGQDAQFVSNGIFFRWLQSPTQAADVQQLTGPAFNGGAPVAMWGGGAPVADVGAFGQPADPVTASMLGLPYPAATPSAQGPLAITGTMKDNGDGTFAFTGTGTPS